jgi:hypothetical protein
MKKLLRNAAILAIGLFLSAVIALTLLEVYLRVSGTRLSMTPGYIITHPERRYTLKPFFRGRTYSAEVKTNSSGLRDYERPVLDDEYKIAVFGDSITFGIGIQAEETFPKIIEKMLNNDLRAGPAVQVFNFGVPSYNTVHEYRYMRESFDIFKPRMVIVEFTAQNDTAMAADECAGINKYKIVRWFKDAFRNLYSYDFLAARFYGLLYERSAKQYNNKYQARLSRDDLYYQDDYEGWIEAKKTFGQMKQFCDSKNIILVFAVFANNIELAPKPEDDLMYPIVKKSITAMRDAGIENIVVLDDAFRKYTGKEKLLWVTPTDSHFSCLAHRLTAKEIVKYIYQKGLIAEQDNG